MTLREWARDRFALLGFNLPASLEMEIFVDVSGDDEISVEGIETAERSIINIIPLLLAAPKSVSESGFSVTRGNLLEWYKALLGKYNLPDSFGVLNTISDVTDLW